MRKPFLALVLLVFCQVLTAQQALNNDSVIKLVKAGLSEDLIVQTINASPGSYDTSTNGLIALKSGGASDKMISTILLKASGAASAALPMAPTAAAGLPAGIQDVGVYYRDKSGAWSPCFPRS